MILLSINTLNPCPLFIFPSQHITSLNHPQHKKIGRHLPQHPSLPFRHLPLYPLLSFIYPLSPFIIFCPPGLQWKYLRKERPSAQFLKQYFLTTMKQAPTLPTFCDHNNALIAHFSRKITKRKLYYDRLYHVLFASFDAVLQEEVNICICCGQEFLGKSIGPHYKNSRKCAEFKRAKEGRLEKDRESKKEERAKEGKDVKEGGKDLKEGGKSAARVPFGERQNQADMADVKLEQSVKEEKEEIFEEDYDQLNEYFEAF